MDETAFLAANGAHYTVFVTGIVDLAVPRLLDVVEGRNGKALTGWVSAQPAAWRGAIATASLEDPFRGHAGQPARSIGLATDQSSGVPTRATLLLRWRLGHQSQEVDD